MDVTPLLRPDQKIIQSYANGRFKISGEIFSGPVIVGADFVRGWTITGAITTLTSDHIAAFANLQGKIDVLLIGTGATASFLRPDTRQAFRAAGLPADLMDTGAACRTFNVLTAEGRRVAAALIPI